MTPKERLDYHQKHSSQHFDRILVMNSNAIDTKVVTPNSDIGTACQYFITHQKELGAFLKYEGVPVSNYLAERTIVYLILLRKNCHFFKTLAGARVADVILGVGISAYYLGVNIFEYFRLILVHKDEVAQNPKEWLPWNFLKRFPEYEIEHKTRRGSWPPTPQAIVVPLAPPR